MATEISIEFTRFSAFYSPLIATMAGGFLKEEGLDAKHSVSAPGKSAIAGLVDGSVHVAQSAPCQGFTPLEQGKMPPALHFAQINEKDGFFLAGRSADPGLHLGQAQGPEGDRRPRRPADGHVQVRLLQERARFQVASPPIDAGSTDKMIAAFRKGEGDYVHLQGPAPQQIEHDGVGHIVASLADAIGTCAFSSLAATREWLADRHGQALHGAPIARRAPG